MSTPVDIVADAEAFMNANAEPRQALEADRATNQRTAQRAVEILLATDTAYRCPTKREREALLIGYAMHRKILYGAAFDVVRLDREIDLTDADQIARNIDAINVCEVKSTNREKLGTDFKGYFFNITAGELLTAQSVGDRYRFVFLNTVTGHHREMALSDVFGRARAMYPAWHIRI